MLPAMGNSRSNTFSCGVITTIGVRTIVSRNRHGERAKLALGNRGYLIMSKKAAEHHKKSSEHLTHAARHHGEAAKHHEAGSHEKAAHHAHVARGHVIHARGHAEEAVKAHLEEHGRNSSKLT